MTKKNKIALLATGNEIINGDIQNSNTQEIALQLFNQGFHIGLHLSAPDDIAVIEHAIHFLLKTHQAIIITGGLGPTSDDMTRYALAKAIDRPLQFDNETWASICERILRFGYKTIPESNRQQALFPENAVIIPNPHGTAAGCFVEHDKQFIFMLPGPPVECLPMMDIVKKTLKNSGFSQFFYQEKWLLFNVSEGKIAEEIDAIAKSFDCVTGYRLCYPYLECKIYSTQQKDFDNLKPLVAKTVAPYLMNEGKEFASVTLKKFLEHSQTKIGICDQATGGLLESIIQTPQTKANLFFSDFPKEIPHVEIKGLTAYWQQEKNKTHTELELVFHFQDSKKIIKTEMIFRDERVKRFAVEFVCYHVLEFLQTVQ